MGRIRQYSANAAAIFPRVILGLATLISLAFPFSYWAVNAEHLGKHNMGIALFFSFACPIAFYVSMGTALASLVLAGIYRVRNRPGSRTLFMAFCICLLPLLFIFWLDYR